MSSAWATHVCDVYTILAFYLDQVNIDVVRDGNGRETIA